MDALLGDPALVDDFFSPSALRRGMPDSARSELSQYPDYTPPPESEWSFSMPDFAGMADSISNFDPFANMLETGLRFGNYMRPSNYGERLYDVTDASFQPYMSDEQRAALPMDDPRRDAIQSQYIGAAEPLAALGLRYAPKVGQAALGAAPEMMNQLERKMGLPQTPFKMDIIAGESHMGGFEKEMLDIAKDMEFKSFDRDKIYQATGLWRGIDDQWRYEIPDDQAKMLTSEFHLSDMANTGETAMASDLMSHPAFEDQLFMQGRASVFPREGGGGSYARRFNPATGGIEEHIKIGVDDIEQPQDFFDVMLHEIQHGVQDEGGLARGGSWTEFDLKSSMTEANSALDAATRLGEMADSKVGRLLAEARGDVKEILRIKDAYPDDYATINRALQIFDLNSVDELIPKAHELSKWSRQLTPEGKYMRLAGEVEARNVEKRHLMTQDERRTFPPWQTQDTPDSLQLVKMDEGGEILGESMSAGKNRNKAINFMKKNDFDPINPETGQPIDLDNPSLSDMAQLNNYGKALGNRGFRAREEMRAAGGFETVEEVIHPIDRPEIDLDVLEDAVLVPMYSDLTTRGHAIQQIGGIPLTNEVFTEGGIDFAYDLGNRHQGMGYASMEDAATRIQNRVTKAAEATGKTPIVTWNAMGKDSFDFSNFPTLAWYDQYQTLSPFITKKAKKAFDRDVRALSQATGKGKAPFPTADQWVGIDDPDALAQLTGTGDYPKEGAGAMRKAVLDRMKQKEYQWQGFPHYGDLMNAVNSPELMNLNLGDAGGLFFEGVPNAPLIPSAHGAYTAGIQGNVLGALPDWVPAEVMYADLLKDLGGGKYGGKYTPRAHRSIFSNQSYQKMTPERIDEIGLFLEQKKKGY